MSRLAQGALAFLALALSATAFGLPNEASAGTATCTYNPDTDTVRIRAGESRYVGLIREGQEIHFYIPSGPTGPCGSATVHNTSTIRLIDGERGFAGFIIDMSRGMFAPGTSEEPIGASEIEFLPGGDMQNQGRLGIVLGGTRDHDVLTFGERGGSVNGDRDRDVRIEKIDRYSMLGRKGPDRLSLQGTHATGREVDPPDEISTIVHGGPGGDLLLGGADRDHLRGGRGSDEGRGMDGSDIIGGGNRNDSMFGNSGRDLVKGDRGDDEISGGRSGDALLAGDGDDFLDGDAGNDECKGGAGNDRYEECETR